MKTISHNLVDIRQIRVFISSTFRDMQDERDELMKKTFPMLRQMAAERDVTLTEIDLRWGITEEESKSGKVVEICLREIENSVPFFIGIIGNRYGWIPKPEDIGGGSLPERFPKVPEYVERHLSVTEMEMQFGVLSRPEDMHAYFFIKEPEIPDDEEPEKLDALKKAVRANKRYPVSTYSSRENLARQVEEAFRKLLDDLFPEGSLSALEKERLGQRAYMNSLCQIYIRTEKNFAALDEWMEDWEKHQLVITGASGLGKSALVANWTKDKLTKEKNLPYKIIYHAVGSGGSLGSDWHVVKSLCDEIRDLYGFDANEASPKTDEKALQELFDRVAFEGDKPLLIVLDAINQIIDVNHAKRLNWLPIPPKNVKILFTTLEDDETMRVFQDRHYPVFTLRPLTRRERIRMVRKYLSIFSKKLKPEQVALIVDDRQSDNTLVMKTLLDELVNFGIYEKLDEKIEEFLKPDSYEDFYQVLLQNYEASFGEQRVRHFLSLIAVSRNGLTEDEILSISQEKPLHWSQFFCSFRQHLIVKNGLVSFSHSYILEAVEGRYIKGHEEWVRSCREDIVSALENEVTPEGKKTPRSMDEVPYQLNRLGDLSRLHNYILDLDVFYYLDHDDQLSLGKYWRRLTEHNHSLTEYLTLVEEKEDSIRLSLLQELEQFNDVTKVAPKLSCFFLGQIIREELKSSLESYRRRFGKNHPFLTVFNNTAGVFDIVYDTKDYYSPTLIEKYLQTTLEIKRLLFGDIHPEVANTYYKAGRCYSLFNFLVEGSHKALSCYLRSLEIRLQAKGEKPSDLANEYNAIARAYGNLEYWQKGLEIELKALDVLRGQCGDFHPSVAASHDMLSFLFFGVNDYQRALKHAQKTLEIGLRLFGDNNPGVAESYFNVGISYDKLGNYQKALEFLLKSLEIRQKIFGDNSLILKENYNKIAIAYFNLNCIQKAFEYELKALVIRFRTPSLLGKTYDEVLSTFGKEGIRYMVYNDTDYLIPEAGLRRFIKDGVAVIPDGVTRIGKEAFSDCTDLTEIHIPNSITEIRYFAFRGCTGLQEIRIPDSVTELRASAFEGCGSLSSIVVSSGNLKYDSRNNCNAIIESETGVLITGCKSTIIPDTVKMIGSSAFEGCSGLTEICIPDSVTEIGESAFEDCSGLTEICIPDSVTVIGKSAFEGCTSLQEISIPDSVTEIGYFAFKGCTSLQKIRIPDSVTSIRGNAFRGCSSLYSIIVSSGNLTYDSKDNCNAIIESETGILITGCKSTILLDAVKVIGSSAFEGCSGLTEISIPDSVTEIGDSAFRGCSGLTEIHLPESLLKIGWWAFSDCVGLKEILIPDRVNDVFLAFVDCPGLRKVSVPRGLDVSRAGFLDSVAIVVRNRKKKELMDGTTVIEESAFIGATELTTIHIPNSVTKIGASAFEGCTNLTEVHMPNSVTMIGASAFEGCTGLTEIHIPNGVTEIGKSAFSKCCGLTEVSIPDSVTEIGDWAFSDCSGLTEIHIPDSVTRIGSFAFFRCVLLKVIRIPEGVTIISEHAFINCVCLAEIYIPDSVTSIEGSAFSNCVRLKEIRIPDYVSRIANTAFWGCTGLKTLSIPKELDISTLDLPEGVQIVRRT